MIKRLRITINGEPFEVEAEVLDETGNPASDHPAGPASVPMAASAPVAAPVMAQAPRSSPAVSGSGKIPSPMSGKLVSFAVKVGDSVAVGDELATVEAMKMNTYVYAETGGKVIELLAQPGDGVEEGQAIMIVK